MFKLVLLRHGESVWNRDNRFTGWTDVGLSERGVNQSREAGRILRENGFTFDIVFTSVLKRAMKTTELVLEEMGLDVPVEKSWRLNEKHYGALQGLYKKKTAEEVGEEQVHKWRRCYDVRPPALEKRDNRHPAKDPLYKGLDEKDLPATECLKDVVERFLPYWHEKIKPAIKSGKKVLVSAHGNSLRALVKHLDKIPDKKIAELNIPVGVPLVYELDDELKPLRHYYLGDQEKIKKMVQSTENEAKIK